MKRPDEYIEPWHDYMDKTSPDRAPIGTWLVVGFLGVVALALAFWFWQFWGMQ